MTAINFTVFKDKILDGRKKQTIRLCRCGLVFKEDPNPRMKRKTCQWHRLKPNDKLQLYWKLRTKETEKLLDAVVTETFDLPYEGGFIVPNMEFLDDIIFRDGFSHENDFSDFFQRYDLYNNEQVFVVVRWK